MKAKLEEMQKKRCRFFRTWCLIFVRLSASFSALFLSLFPPKVLMKMMSKAKGKLFLLKNLKKTCLLLVVVD